MLSHDTFKTSPDINGNCHRACLDRFSSKNSKNIVTYTAKLYTFAKNKYSDPRHERVCKAKLPASSPGTERWAMGEIARSDSVRKSADVFNKTLSQNGPQITFTFQQRAMLESAAILSCRHFGEYVLIEDKLPDFTHFIDINGRNVENRRRSFKRKSSKCSRSRSRNSDSDSCSGHQHSSEHTPFELATPAQDINNYLTPSCPPCELDDSPPSYDEIYGPRVNTDIQLEADYINFNCMNYYQGNMNNDPVCRFNITSCSKNCPDSVRCEVVQAGTEISNWNYDETDKLPHPQLRALIHFDFYLAEGQRVISNLKGTLVYGDKYTLTTPTFHSLTRTHGERDMGKNGIKTVIKNHKCSRWCRQLPSMSDIFEAANQSLTSNINHSSHR